MRVAMLGTGLMGAPMAVRLLEGGQTVTAYNRTPEKLAPLEAAGATTAATPAEAIAAGECVVVMVTNAPAIRELLLSETARPALSERTILQMSTIAPDESRAIAAEVQAAGGDYLEAPVLGSIPQAQSGTLQVMVGGTVEQFRQWSPFLKYFGPPEHVGATGQAAALKLALNQLIVSLTSAFALSLSFVRAQGADVETFMGILRESALYAPTFDKKLARMMESNYANPNFPTKHLLKDADLFAAAARAAGLGTETIDGARAVIERAIALGLADGDYSALHEGIRQPT